MVHKGRETVISKNSNNRALYFLMRGQVIAADAPIEDRETRVEDRMLFSIQTEGACFDERTLP